MLKTRNSSSAVGVTVLVIILMILFLVLVQQEEDRLPVQILVGVTLVTGFSFGAIERVRGMRPGLRPGETVLNSSTTRLMDGLIGIDGLLTLTSQRLVFAPLWPGPVVEIPRSEATRACAPDPIRLLVSTRQGEYGFEIQGALEWAALLRAGAERR